MAVIVGVIVARPAEAVKNARLVGSVKFADEESGRMIGGNVTVSVAEPNGPAFAGELETVRVGCEMGWFRPSIE